MHEFSRAFKDPLDTLRREWKRRLCSLLNFPPLDDEVLRASGSLTGCGASLLITGTQDADYSGIKQVLERDHATIIAAASPEAAARLLENSEFDAVIVLAGDGIRGYFPFLAALRAHPATKKLPVLAVMAPKAAEMATFSLNRLSVTVAPQPAPEAELRQWVLDAVLHGRLARALAMDHATAAPAAAGSAPGVFSNAFARAHLETLLSSPHAVMTSLASFEMTFAGGGRHDESALVKLRKETAVRLIQLLPGEVTVSDAPADSLWLLFPETRRTAANIVLNQAVQSLRARPLMLDGGADMIDLFPRFRILTARPGDNVLAFVRRCEARLPKRARRLLQ